MRIHFFSRGKIVLFTFALPGRRHFESETEATKTVLLPKSEQKTRLFTENYQNKCFFRKIEKKFVESAGFF